MAETRQRFWGKRKQEKNLHISHTTALIKRNLGSLESSRLVLIMWD